MKKKLWILSLCLIGILALTLSVHAQSTARQAAGPSTPDVARFLASLAPPAPTAPEAPGLPPAIAASCTVTQCTSRCDSCGPGCVSTCASTTTCSCYCRRLNPSISCTF